MTTFHLRRQALMKQADPSSAFLLQSAKITFRNHYHEYPWRQDSDFWYLTGFDEPSAMAVLLPDRAGGKFVLFCQEKNPAEEIWTGKRAGSADAITQYGADEAFPVGEFAQRFPELIENRQTLYYAMGARPALDRKIMKALGVLHKKYRAGVQAPVRLADIRPLLHEQRLVKHPDEIAQLQKAADISCSGHIRAMQVCRPGMHEYELEAELTHAFQRQGARHHAYTPIIGSGANSCILHYVKNMDEIHAGDIVMIDAGAEYACYAADISRTFPASGRFSAEQRAVYEVVLAAQEAGIALTKPGVTWDSIEEKVTRILTEGLKALGLLKGETDGLIEQRAYFPFYMHRSGHWLGLDVHDAGSYRTPAGKWRSLVPGMVRTIEPGLYISASLPNVPKRWHNIGVRIEDDVLVTETGNRVLSAAAPKTIAAIEALMAG